MRPFLNEKLARVLMVLEDRLYNQEQRIQREKLDLSYLTKTFSATPVGLEIVRSANSNTIFVSVRPESLSFFQMDKGMRLILAPKSARANSVSFVTSLSFSTTGGGIGGPSYETPLRVVIALASFLGFGMVLLGKELDLKVVVVSKLRLSFDSSVCERHLDDVILSPQRGSAICCISKEFLEGEEIERGAVVRVSGSQIVKYPVGEVLESHGEGLDEGGKYWFMNFETRSSHVRIDLGGSLSNQSRASPSREKGKQS
ncbi:hypothetical protein Tco_0397941 [Tanacetum coccineum]